MNGKPLISICIPAYKRIEFLKSPKGLAYREFLGFIKEHFPKSYNAVYLKLWLKTLFPFIWDTLKK